MDRKNYFHDRYTNNKDRSKLNARISYLKKSRGDDDDMYNFLLLGRKLNLDPKTLLDLSNV